MSDILSAICPLRVQKLSIKQRKRIFVVCSKVPYFRGFLHTSTNCNKCAEIFNSRTGHHIGTIKKMHTEKSAIYSGFLAFREQKFYSKNRRCFLENF